jgi:CubicO group peptidase (beta-lactamase class C family)
MAVSSSALANVVEVFERNFRERGELGAAVSIWCDGEEVFSRSHGWCERAKTRPWTRDTLVPVFSATKVPSAATLLLALASRGLNEETPVREVWPKFPVPNARFCHLLSHQCGLSALDRRASILDHAAVVEAIEEQTPAWVLGDGHGYHPRTFGALVDEPVRRLTGLTLGGYWREMIAGPLGLDFWIGLPPGEWPRVARLYPGRAGADDLADAFAKQLTVSGSFTRRAFASPRGLHAIQDMNESRAWSAGLAALGGVGTATALAKFYQAAIGALASPLPARVCQALATPQSAGDDRVLLRPTVFTCGAQQDPLDGEGRKIRQIYGPSLAAFGHPGAGGSHGLGDPASGIAFAYVMNQMNVSVMPGVKCLELVEAVFGAG